MAKFLNAAGAQAALVDLLKNAEKELFIVSPYLKLSSLMKIYLSSVDNKGISTSIVYRSDTKLTDEDLAFFKGLSNLKLYQCDNLHTKCYINEREGLITSMNLHEHSQSHNWEMGILFSKEGDAEIFTDVTQELQLMASHLKLQSFSKPGAPAHEKTVSVPKRTTPQHTVHKPTGPPKKGMLDKIFDTVTGEAGFCIRCGEGIAEFDLNSPYCHRCYASWVRYKNVKYAEKYCHGCGLEVKDKISFEKPLCRECFTKFYQK
jgi:HKD family nuclease